MNVTALVAANCRSRKIDSGSIGAAARCSRARKAARPATPSNAIVNTAANQTMPIRYTFRLPNRSPSEPPISRNAARVRM